MRPCSPACVQNLPGTPEPRPAPHVEIDRCRSKPNPLGDKDLRGGPPLRGNGGDHSRPAPARAPARAPTAFASLSAAIESSDAASRRSRSASCNSSRRSRGSVCSGRALFVGVSFIVIFIVVQSWARCGPSGMGFLPQRHPPEPRAGRPADELAASPSPSRSHAAGVSVQQRFGAQFDQEGAKALGRDAARERRRASTALSRCATSPGSTPRQTRAGRLGWRKRTPAPRTPVRWPWPS